MHQSGAMTSWEPRRLREMRIQEIDARIAQRMGSGELHFERACLLAEVGRASEARDAYLDLLARDPAHRLALNNLGTLLYESGYRTAARTAYREAVARHPHDVMSRVNLGNALREAGELDQAREHYEAALRIEPQHAEAHQGMAYVLAESGDTHGARLHREMGFASRAVVALPYRGAEAPVVVLMLAAAEGGNIPRRYLFDDRVFQTFLVFPEFLDPGAPLPPHRLVFNAIGDADLARRALVAAERLLERTKAPVINPPRAVLTTGRTDIARRLASIAGVLTARAVTVGRTEVSAATLARHGFEFPVLIRTPGFHTGRHFVKVDTAEDLHIAIGTLPGEELTILSYLDARGADGKVRKYRVMMIGGGVYPLHVAVSSQWKVHYFTADMAESTAHGRRKVVSGS